MARLWRNRWFETSDTKLPIFQRLQDSERIMLKLLKKEVGELALQAIQQGDVSEHSLLSLPSATVTRFDGPEYNRERARRKQASISPKATNDMLSALRTGGIS